MPTPALSLLPDELLSTTRSLRRRLDLGRPVARSLVEECLELAQYAPTGGNVQGWHFVVVADVAKRAALAELYRKAWTLYRAASGTAASRQYDDPVYAATQERVVSSAQYLADHLHEAPVHVIPCVTGRTDGQPAVTWSVLDHERAPKAGYRALAGAQPTPARRRRAATARDGRRWDGRRGRRGWGDRVGRRRGSPRAAASEDPGGRAGVLRSALCAQASSHA